MKKGLIPFVKAAANGAGHIYSCQLANRIDFNLIVNVIRMLREKHRMIAFLQLKATKKGSA
jgi:hypothetical protein